MHWASIFNLYPKSWRFFLINSRENDLKFTLIRYGLSVAFAVGGGE